MNKPIRVALSCALILLFIGGSIAAAEQTKFEKPGKIKTPDGRYIMNESDFDNAVIESGTVKIPKTSSIAERVEATKKAMDQLSVKIKAPDEEVLDTLCDYTAAECSYRVAKLVKAPAGSVLPKFGGWAENANYHNSDGGSTTFLKELGLFHRLHSTRRRRFRPYFTLQHCRTEMGVFSSPYWSGDSPEETIGILRRIMG